MICQPSLTIICFEFRHSTQTVSFQPSSTFSGPITFDPSTSSFESIGSGIAHRLHFREQLVIPQFTSSLLSKKSVFRSPNTKDGRDESNCSNLFGGWMVFNYKELPQSLNWVTIHGDFVIDWNKFLHFTHIFEVQPSGMFFLILMFHSISFSSMMLFVFNDEIQSSLNISQLWIAQFFSSRFLKKFENGLPIIKFWPSSSKETETSGFWLKISSRAVLQSLI